MIRFSVAAALLLVACGGQGTPASNKNSQAAQTQAASPSGGTSAAVATTKNRPQAVSAINSQAQTAERGESAATASTSPSPNSTPNRHAADRTGKPVVRGLYVNRFAAQSKRKMASLIAMADSTEINAFVIDIKDEFGINYKSTDSTVLRSAGRAGSIPELPALLDTLRAHGILAIARIVVFKDSVAARVNPEWTIRRQDGSAWRDREGLAWVNPYNRSLWDLNIRVAEEVARLGFDEIQWDYIRFPEPYKSLPQQVFPDANGVGKPEALAAFLGEARTRLRKLGVASTADIFGLVTSVNGTLEIGQKWELLAASTDVLLPMVYPSHYPRGAFGADRPNAEPYRVVLGAVRKAHDRNIALGLTGESVRPWLQAFTLGQPQYGAEHVLEQKRAVYDAGFDGWVLWHPGSKYELFAAALEPKLESRRKPYPAVAQQPQNER